MEGLDLLTRVEDSEETVGVSKPQLLNWDDCCEPSSMGMIMHDVLARLFYFGEDEFSLLLSAIGNESPSFSSQLNDEFEKHDQHNMTAESELSTLSKNDLIELCRQLFIGYQILRVKCCQINKIKEIKSCVENSYLIMINRLQQEKMKNNKLFDKVRKYESMLKNANDQIANLQDTVKRSSIQNLLTATGLPSNNSANSGNSLNHSPLSPLTPLSAGHSPNSPPRNNLSNNNYFNYNNNNSNNSNNNYNNNNSNNGEIMNANEFESKSDVYVSHNRSGRRNTQELRNQMRNIVLAKQLSSQWMKDAQTRRSNKSSRSKRESHGQSNNDVSKQEKENRLRKTRQSIRGIVAAKKLGARWKQHARDSRQNLLDFDKSNSGSRMNSSNKINNVSFNIIDTSDDEDESNSNNYYSDLNPGIRRAVTVHTTTRKTVKNSKKNESGMNRSTSSSNNKTKKAKLKAKTPRSKTQRGTKLPGKYYSTDDTSLTKSKSVRSMKSNKSMKSGKKGSKGVSKKKNTNKIEGRGRSNTVNKGNNKKGGKNSVKNNKGIKNKGTKNHKKRSSDDLDTYKSRKKNLEKKKASKNKGKKSSKVKSMSRKNSISKNSMFSTDDETDDDDGANNKLGLGKLSLEPLDSTRVHDYGKDNDDEDEDPHDKFQRRMDDLDELSSKLMNESAKKTQLTEDIYGKLHNVQ